MRRQDPDDYGPETWGEKAAELVLAIVVSACFFGAMWCIAIVVMG